MNRNRYDDTIRKAIETGTQGAVDAKGEVWNRITHETEKGGINMRRKSRLLTKLAAAAAVAAILTAWAFTPAGQAAVRRIADLFAPQKDITLEIEGQQEEVDEQLHIGPTSAAPSDDQGDLPAMTYVMYVDESRYEYVPAEQGEKIVPRDYPDYLPEVSLSIVEDTGLSADELVLDYEGYLGEHYPIVMDTETVTDPLPAVHLMAAAGTEWDDEMIEYYLVDNQRGGTYILTLRYFVEAEDGHAVRFRQMLQEFKVVEADPS